MNLWHFCAGAIVTLSIMAMLVGYSALVVAGRADEASGEDER